MAEQGVKTEKPEHRSYKTLMEKSNNIKTEIKFFPSIKERKE